MKQADVDRARMRANKAEKMRIAALSWAEFDNDKETKHFPHVARCPTCGTRLDKAVGRICTGCGMPINREKGGSA